MPVLTSVVDSNLVKATPETLSIQSNSETKFSATSNGNYLNDLYIDKIDISPVTPPTYRIYVGVKKKCGWLPAIPSLSVYHDDIVINTTAMAILNTSLSCSYYGLVGTQDLIEGSNLTVAIDLPGFTDFNPGNNILSLIYHLQADLPPPTITTAEGTLQRQGDLQNITLTGYFPYMVLRVIPFERTECALPATTSTKFMKSGSITQTHEEWTTITAGIAIEAEVGFSPVASVTFGLEIETEFENHQSQSSSKTIGSGYTWQVNVANPLVSDGIIAEQTKFERYKYKFIDGSNNGKGVWLGRPAVGFPKLTLMRLDAYNDHYKDAEAPEIRFHGSVGDLDSYYTGRSANSPWNASGHFDYDLLFDSYEHNNQLFTQGISSSGLQDWNYIVEHNTGITTSQSVSANFYVKGTIAGKASVQASFGSQWGWSHTTTVGKKSEYGGDIAPVTVDTEQFWIIPWFAKTRNGTGFVFVSYYWEPEWVWLDILPSIYGFTSPPAGRNGPYPVNIVKTVTANAYSNYYFSSWIFNGAWHSSTNPEDFQLDNNAPERDKSKLVHTLEATYIYIGPHEYVGGIWVPVDRFGLLAPYIGLALIILVATVATATYAKRVKCRETKNTQ